jgi:hypothetical protein
MPSTSNFGPRVYGTGAIGTVSIAVYRFPTSSELVVTPERQNVWGGVVYTNQQQSIFIGSTAGTTRSYFNNAAWNQPTLLKGKAAVSTTNSGNALGFSIPNLPVGQYKLEISGLIGAGQGGSATVNIDTKCNFYIKETTTSTDVARQAHQDWSVTTSTNEETRDWINSFSGVFNNTSVGTRDFILEAMKFNDASGTNGFCQAFSQTNAGAAINSNITFLLTPLDQPSNSALYVQGPVLSGQTGSVLPAGYIGEIITSTSASSGTIPTNVTLGQNVGTLTLTPGTWLVSAALEFSGATTANINMLGISTVSATLQGSAVSQPQPAVATAYGSFAYVTRILRVTTNTPIYAVIRTWYPSGTSTYGGMEFQAVRIGSN